MAIAKRIIPTLLLFSTIAISSIAEGERWLVGIDAEPSRQLRSIALPTIATSLDSTVVVFGATGGDQAFDVFSNTPYAIHLDAGWVEVLTDTTSNDQITPIRFAVSPNQDTLQRQTIVSFIAENGGKRIEITIDQAAAKPIVIEEPILDQPTDSVI